MSAPLFIAGASVRAAAQSAVRANCSVTAADLFGDRDLTGIAETHLMDPYPDALRAIADRVPAMDWLYTGGLENYPDLVDAVSQRHRLLGNPGDALRRARDPWEWESVLQQAGLPCPGPRRQLPSAPAGRWLIKPLASSGGGRIRELRLVPHGIEEQQRSAHCGCATVREGTSSQLHEAPDGYYFQPWIPGRSLSASYVAAERSVTLLCVTRQLVGCTWSGSRGFEYVGSVGPLRLPERLQRKFETIGTLLARHWGLRGLFGIDTILSGDEVWTIEVNPRYPASVEVWERATGACAVAWHRAACLTHSLEGSVVPPARHVVGKAIVNSPQEVTIDSEMDAELMRLEPPGQGPGLADLPRLGQTIPAGAPVLTVIAEGAEYRATYRRLRTCVRQLREALKRH